MTRTLIVVRHAKSDWSSPVSDDERPLAARGRRQAPEIGRWIAAHSDPLDLAVVSTARRARETWDLASAELSAPPPVRVSPAAYTFAGEDLRELVGGLPPHATTVAVVGHNPAVEELVAALTGRWVRMPTASLAVISLAAWATTIGELLAAGRPADHDLALRPGDGTS